MISLMSDNPLDNIADFHMKTREPCREAGLCTKEGNSLIQEAVSKGNLEMTRLLIESGSSVQGGFLKVSVKFYATYVL